MKETLEKYDFDERETVAVRTFWSYYNRLSEARKVAEVERKISQQGGFLPKANFDARILLGLKEKDVPFQNPGFTYADMGFAELVKALEKVVDFSGKKVRFWTVEELGVRQSLLTRPEAKDVLSEPFFFVAASYHPRNSRDIRYQGIFTLRPGEEQVLELQYFSFNKQEAPTNGNSYTGRYEKHSGTLFFTFSEKKHQKLYIFRLNNIEQDRINYMHGVYAGDSRGAPIAGEIFLERVASPELASRKMHTLVPEVARYMLKSSRFRVEVGAFHDLEEIPKTAGLRLVNQFVGSYLGHYLSKKSKKLICECVLQINSDGSAKMWRYEDPNGIDGVVYIREKQQIFLLFQYDPHLERYISSLNLQHFHDRPIRLRGDYGSARDEYMPDAGRIIFQAVSDVQPDDPPHRIAYNIQATDEMGDFLKKSPFYRDVLHFLRGQDRDEFSDDPYQLFAGTPYDLAGTPPASLSPDPSYPAPRVTLRKQWVGTYEAYILQYFQNREHKFVVQRLEAVIQPDQIRIKSLENEYVGQYLPNADNHYLLTALTKNHQPDAEMFLCMNRTPHLQNLKNAAITGVYSGMGQGDLNLPVAGRIILYPCQNNEPVLPEEFNLHLYDVNWNNLLRKRKNLLNFFIGQYDFMMESYPFFRDSFLLPAPTIDLRQTAAQLAGVYLSYKIDPSRQYINIQPLRIQKNGHVTVLSTYGRREYRGVVNLYPNLVFALNLYALGNDDGLGDFYAQSLFHRPSELGEVKYLRGLHLAQMVSSREGIFGCRQVLINVSKKSGDFEMYRSQTKQVSIPINGITKDLQVFWEIDQQYPGLMTYLLGEESNIMVHNQGMSGDEFSKDTDYGLLHFLAASYYAESSKVNEKHRKKALQAWEKAVFNGFANLDLLKDYLESNRFPGLVEHISANDLLQSAPLPDPSYSQVS